MKLDSFRTLCSTFLAGAVLASNAALADAIFIVVDDNGGNDSAFSYTPGTPGQVGNYSGSGAVLAALDALKANPNAASVTSAEIRIIDTDGSADTYVGTYTGTVPNLTIRQAPNGSGNDAPVTLQGGAGALGVFYVNTLGVTISGLSTEKRMIVDANNDPHCLAVEGSISDIDTVFENLETIDSNGGGSDTNNWNASFQTGTPAVTYRGCRFTLANGPSVALDNTLFENCVLDATGFLFILDATADNTQFTNCLLTATSAGPFWGGDVDTGDVTFTGCTFQASPARFIDGAGTFGPANATITLVDPVFEGLMGVTPFYTADNNVDLVVEGTDPANKVDLDPLFPGGSIFAKVNSGSVTLRNVECSHNGFFIWSQEAPNALTGDVTYNIEDSVFSNGSGSILSLDGGGAFDITINVSNSIYTGSNPWRAIFETSGASTGNNAINLDHVTLAQGTTSVLMEGDGGSTNVTITANNSIFDTTNGGSGFITTGSTPISAGSNNIRKAISAGEAGGTVIDAFVPIAADGTLTAASAAAIGLAAGSSLVADFEGDARPLPVGSVADAGADESALGPDDFGWPLEARKVETTAPTVDGTVNVATEYTHYGSAAPIAVSLSGISATNALDGSLTNDGGSLQSPVGGITGTIADDVDLSATAYLVWDDDALYIGVVGQDDELNPVLNPGVNGGDALQIAIDYDETDATAADTDGKVFIPSWTVGANSNDPQYFEQFWPTSSANPMPGVSQAVTTGSGTFQLEARIPWTAITNNGTISFTNAFPPIDGQTAGMLVTLLDHDQEIAGGATEFSFLLTAGAGRNIIGNASEYNTLTFVDPGSSVGDWMLLND